jgi:DNA-binding response OmpR family regulator
MKILVIEDEKDISDLLKCGLEAEGFVVDAAMDGEKGCFMGRANNYDLIILDLNLPKKNGEAVCREIRETGKTTPILILTVDAQINSKIRLLNSGGDDYLTKPFSFEELLARVKALLRRPKTMTKEILRIGNLTLDKNKQTVYRASREIYLTRKEFALLEYLMRNQGIVVSRSEILENVWDAEADPFSNTIETHILNLRRKINKNSANKLIKTVSGRGYKIS